MVHTAVRAAVAVLTVAFITTLAAAQECPLKDEQDRVRLGNGHCDAKVNTPFNTAACDWDGGDCCQQTCRGNPKHRCGFAANNTVQIGFPQCADPGVCRAQDPTLLGNGRCDDANGTAYNTAACGWDGGDCCWSSCRSSANYTCGFNPAQTARVGFPSCADPHACRVRDIDKLGNGHCDDSNGTAYNTAVCAWDGGDCCASTCEDTANYTCGFNSDQSVQIGFSSCEDPRACRAPDRSRLGNGRCDAGASGANGSTASLYNTAVCGWDGGDCCEDSCNSTHFQCGVNANGTSVGFPQCADPVHNVSCPAANRSLVGNGHCNALGAYNTKACGWDGGDCCAATCRDKPAHECGKNLNNSRDLGFPHCEDPDVCRAPDPLLLGNGRCDDANATTYNTAACNWDGGDCCEATCHDSANFTCGSGANGAQVGFSTCRDPAHPPVFLPPGIANCTSAPRFSIAARFRDGACDHGGSNTLNLNTEACDWDGGDCCAQTCSGRRPGQCGRAPADDDDDDDDSSESVFVCRNPAVLEAAGHNGDCVVATLSWVGDGYCDSGSYNTDACGWDGGDCCNATCTSTDAFPCGAGGFDCRDANASDHGRCPPHDPGSRARAGNGVCDMSGATLAYRLNRAACGWDGGDCCPSTCTNGNGSAACPTNHSAWECRDPNATDAGRNSRCRVAQTSWLGDGACDIDGNYNTDACGWDAGDCCPSTCRSRGTDAYTCGQRRFQCRDPDAFENNRPESNSTGAPGVRRCQPAAPLSWIGDGHCDNDVDGANTRRCGWDGGDCCPETCEDGQLYVCANVLGQPEEEGGARDLYASCEDPAHRPTTPASSSPPPPASTAASGAAPAAASTAAPAAASTAAGVVDDVTDDEQGGQEQEEEEVEAAGLDTGTAATASGAAAAMAGCLAVAQAWQGQAR